MSGLITKVVFYLYLLKSERCNRFYIGSTNSLERRLLQHNVTGHGFTKSCRPWILVYTETFSTRSEAVRRERYLKSLKNKEKLVSIVNAGVEE